MSDNLDKRLIPCAYRIGDLHNWPSALEIRESLQSGGIIKWRITRYGTADYPYVLNKSGVWEWEPQPSSRTDAFLERCRFDTLEEATKAALEDWESCI